MANPVVHRHMGKFMQLPQDHVNAFIVEGDRASVIVDATLALRPSPGWQLSIAPSFLHQVDTQQYITSLVGGPELTYGRRYVFGEIDRSTFSMQLRTTYTLKPDMTLDGIRGIRPRPGDERRSLWKTAGLVDEHTHGDLGRGLWIGQAEPGDVALDRSVELDLAGLHQLHNRQGGKRFGDRADDKWRLRRDRASGGVRLSVALQIDDPVAFHDRKR